MAYGPLKLTARQLYDLTPYEFTNMYHGYIWRYRKYEMTIGDLITTWIHNCAPVFGKKPRKKITLKDLFPEAYRKYLTQEEIEDFLLECDRG